MPRQLLIVGDAGGLAARLAAAGYGVQVASTLEAARAALGRIVPDILVLDADFGDPGAEWLARLVRARGAGGHVPVLLLDKGHGSALPGGVVDAVQRMPVSDTLILARLRSLLRLRDLEEDMALRAATFRDLGMAEPGRRFTRSPDVLLALKRPRDALGLADALSFELSATISMHSREASFGDLEGRGIPDVIVIDADPEDPTSDVTCIPDLRALPEARHATLVMLLPAQAEAAAAMALDLGATDVVVGMDAPGGPGPAMLAAVIRRHLDRADRAAALSNQLAQGLRLAAIDPLTGLHNRRYALGHVARLVERAADARQTLALMVLDIDRFKQVNDTFGHLSGDRVIEAVARRLSEAVRSSDLVARIGGEEFLVAMPDTTPDDASRAAERLRSAVEGMVVPLRCGSRVSVTVSIGLRVGIPERTPAGELVPFLIAEADNALFVAKEAGRNHVVQARSAARRPATLDCQENMTLSEPAIRPAGHFASVVRPPAGTIERPLDAIGEVAAVRGARLGDRVDQRPVADVLPCDNRFAEPVKHGGEDPGIEGLRPKRI